MKLSHMPPIKNSPTPRGFMGSQLGTAALNQYVNLFLYFYLCETWCSQDSEYIYVTSCNLVNVYEHLGRTSANIYQTTQRQSHNLQNFTCYFTRVRHDLQSK
jgi:hypothetical protein